MQKPGKFDLPSYGGNSLNRRDAVEALCPCRNSDFRDVEEWRELFRLCREGSKAERGKAAHNIGTLIHLAERNAELRALLQSLSADLVELMAHPKAMSALLGTMKPHGHSRRGTAMKTLRKRLRNLDVRNPDEVAAWIRLHFGVSDRVLNARNPGVRRLSTWLRRRQEKQPEIKTRIAELEKQALRLVPELQAL